MRKIHRWISTVGMVVLFYLVVSGTLLAVDEFINRDVLEDLGPGAAQPGGAPTISALPPADQLEAMTAVVLKAALANSAATSLSQLHVRLQMQGDQAQGIVTLGGADNRTLAFNATTGEAIAMPTRTAPGGSGGPSRPSDMGPGSGPGGAGAKADNRVGPGSLNGLFMELHTGQIAGRVGQWIIILTGACFVVLSFTGIWMYFQLRGARSKRGRKEWFWS